MLLKRCILVNALDNVIYLSDQIHHTPRFLIYRGNVYKTETSNLVRTEEYGVTPWMLETQRFRPQVEFGLVKRNILLKPQVDKVFGFASEYQQVSPEVLLQIKDFLQYIQILSKQVYRVRLSDSHVEIVFRCGPKLPSFVKEPQIDLYCKC